MLNSLEKQSRTILFKGVLYYENDLKLLRNIKLRKKRTEQVNRKNKENELTLYTKSKKWMHTRRKQNDVMEDVISQCIWCNKYTYIYKYINLYM